MRTSFELKILAPNLEEATKIAEGEVARFLGIDPSEVKEKVSIELKVSYPKAETREEIYESVEKWGIFQITVYGSLKQSVVKPFGL
jgi:hypothetical protein